MLPDVIERERRSWKILSKLVLSFSFEKHFVVLEHFPASLKVLEQL